MVRQRILQHLPFWPALADCTYCMRIQNAPSTAMRLNVMKRTVTSRGSPGTLFLQSFLTAGEWPTEIVACRRDLSLRI